MLTEEFEHKYTSINIVKRTLLFLYYSGEKRREGRKENMDYQVLLYYNYTTIEDPE